MSSLINSVGLSSQVQAVNNSPVFSAKNNVLSRIRKSQFGQGLGVFWQQRDQNAGMSNVVARRRDTWGSFNAASRNIRDAQTITGTAVDNLFEVNVLLEAAKSIVQEAANSNDQRERAFLQDQLDSIMGMIDAQNRSNKRAVSGAISRSVSDTSMLMERAQGANSRNGLARGSGIVITDYPFTGIWNNLTPELQMLSEDLRYSVNALDQIRARYLEIRSVYEADPSAGEDNLKPYMNEIYGLAQALGEFDIRIDQDIRQFVNKLDTYIKTNSGTMDQYALGQYKWFMDTYFHLSPQYLLNMFAPIKAGAEQTMNAIDAIRNSGSGSMIDAFAGLTNAIEGRDSNGNLIAGGTGGSHGLFFDWESDAQRQLSGLSEFISYIVGLGPGSPMDGRDPVPLPPVTIIPPTEPGGSDGEDKGPDGSDGEDKDGGNTDGGNTGGSTVRPPSISQPPANQIEPPTREVKDILTFQVGINANDRWKVEILLVNTDTLALRNSDGTLAFDLQNANSQQFADMNTRLDNALSFVLTERVNMESARFRLYSEERRLNDQRYSLDPIEPWRRNTPTPNIDKESLDRMMRMAVLQGLSRNPNMAVLQNLPKNPADTSEG
jgi:flagellin-like hook-associated protein FlgL